MALAQVMAVIAEAEARAEEKAAEREKRVAEREARLDAKVEEWKASYHSVRSLVYLQDWIDAERAVRGRGGAR